VVQIIHKSRNAILTLHKTLIL